MATEKDEIVGRIRQFANLTVDAFPSGATLVAIERLPDDPNAFMLQISTARRTASFPVRFSNHLGEFADNIVNAAQEARIF